MKKFLAFILINFVYFGSASAANYSLSGKSVSESFVPTGITSQTSSSNGATWNQTTNSQNEITSETICSANNNCVNFNGSNGSYTGLLGNGALRFFYNSNQFALQARPSYFGWSYQSFGVWANSVSGTGQASAGSFGSYTAGSSIPRSGTATYNGLEDGIFAQGSNTKYFVFANMSATVNFSSRSILFSTSNSIYSPTINGTYSAAPGLNMTGNLTYSANTNNFSGTVHTSGNTVLTGTASGQFYGPAAQEIGVVFAVKNGNIGFIGGFGGKK